MRRECILGVLAANPKCPLCRRQLAPAEVRTGVTAAEADAAEAEAEAAEAAAAQADAGKGKAPVEEEEEGGAAVPPAEPTYVSESKLRALLKELRAMRRADPTAKALVFSQVGFKRGQSGQNNPPAFPNQAPTNQKMHSPRGRST